MAAPRTIFIGDIHGCADEFRELLSRISHSPRYDKLYITGDSFARGPLPVETLRLIKESRAQSVLGNHDWKMLVYLRRLMNGEPAGAKPGNAQMRAIEAMSSVRDELRDYLESLPVSIIGWGWVVVHAAVHPERGTLGTDLEYALTARTFPGPNVQGAPKWYDCRKSTKPLIIFGHDAIAGLVRREHEGRPVTIGLDSGCVYGGSLSAYILEDDSIVSVKAAEKYSIPKLSDMNP